jgi:hypothetical protein
MNCSLYPIISKINPIYNQDYTKNVGALIVILNSDTHIVKTTATVQNYFRVLLQSQLSIKIK